MLKIVQLRAAKIPFIGYIAAHYWFVIIKENKIDRWEIWHKANKSKHSWGHLHKNLMPPKRGVGNGESWLDNQWSGEQADLLIRVIENSPTEYKYNTLYHYWPGPNSNTYIQWILNKAKTNYRLSRLGIGKSYGTLKTLQS